MKAINTLKLTVLVAAAPVAPIYAQSQLNGKDSLMAKDGLSSGILLRCEESARVAVVERDGGMLNVLYTNNGTEALNFRSLNASTGFAKMTLEDSAKRAATDYCNSGRILAPNYYQ